MLFSQIATLTNGEILQLHKDTHILELAFDTRRLSSTGSTVFFALDGKNKNGHHYLKQAYEKGVRNFVVSDSIVVPDFAEANILAVADSLKTLQDLACNHRQQFDIPVIAITGSNGKTIVKEWLSDVLAEKFNVVKSPKSFNSQLGVPLSVWKISKEHEIGVFEAGISQTGEMQNLQKIINPQIGIFTNIGEAHNEGFDSLEEKLREKSHLFENSDKVICSKDQAKLYPFLKDRFPAKLICWSTLDKEASLFFEKNQSGYQCEYEELLYRFEVEDHHGYYLENLLHVITAAIVLGLSNEEINHGISRIRPVPMRLELKLGVNDCYVLDDTYNNDISGLDIALDYLKLQVQNKSKTVVLSDIQQSGLESVELYKKVNELLVRNEVTRLIGIGEEISRNRLLFSLNAAFYASTNEFLNSLPSFENELILVKGARSFSLEKVVNLLEERSHGTVLEVNFESLTHNLNTYRGRLKPETKLMVMVKAFAYGGGLSEIASLLQYQGVDYLGVAYLDEGIELRRKGIKLPIMVMNPDWDHLSLTESFDLEPEIYSLPMLRRFIEATENTPSIHLKIETGMNRLGFRAEEIDGLIDTLLQNPNVKVAGVFTHFAGSEEEVHDEFTIQQAMKFNQAYDRVAEVLGYRPVKHALNSSGIVRWPQYQFDMARLGIGLYGYDSSEELNGLKSISELKSRISQIRQIKKGESVGYSRKGTVGKDSQIAIISIGYADGYLRKFGGGQAFMTLNGEKAYTVGNICMDMTMIDVTGIECKEGDEVTVFGENPSIEDLAEWAETIPYEILTNVSQRVKRVFVSE
ncbi:MAG: bifunctional UDP-N-acetylmuramoyl-tripeptide:D-alanyl-D-alanine ligase/alanine racemase [Cyclobacteriaceae bacterium]